METAVRTKSSQDLKIQRPKNEEIEFPFLAHMSEGSIDLISRLLKHNLMHRLRMRDVMVHPWVVDNSKKPTSHTTQQLKTKLAVQI